MRKKHEVKILPRIRIMKGDAIAMGPGKADLLEAVANKGSLGLAANQLGMSYMRAWQLIQTMNRSFRHPLVSMERGGKTGGGAKLTLVGKRILQLYRKMEKVTLNSTKRYSVRLIQELE